MEKREFKIGIVGAGTMGSGLVQLFAQSGFPVTVVEQDEAKLEAGLNKLNDSVERGLKKGVFNKRQAADIKNNVDGFVRLQRLSDCRLVIEAVYEQLTIKQTLFKELEGVCGKKTLFATNTSSFRVADMSASPSMQGRMLGMHFFYPPSQNRLLEVIYPDKLAEKQKRIIEAVCSATARVTIHCKDECAFVVNRFFVPWLNEAAKMLDEKMGTVKQINELSKREFDTGLGAFEIMNLIGLAPVWQAMQTLNKRFGDSYTPANSLKQQLTDRKPWVLDDTPTEGTLKVVAPNHADERFRNVVFSAVDELLTNKICTANEVAIGARVGLRWNKDPISRMQELGTKSKVSLERQFIHHETIEKTRVIQLNRPEAMNALNMQLLTELDGALKQALADNSVENIILRGTGKTFAAGGDLYFLREALRASKFDETDRYFAFAQKLFTNIDNSPKPVAAFIESMALGGGVQLALAADVIVASPSATFEFPETGLGLFPGLGGTQRLPKRIGRELAKYMVFTGNRLEADMALGIGLIDAIIYKLDWFDETREYVENVELVRQQKVERTMPVNMMQVAALMNSKNVSRLISRKDSNLPESMAEIYEATKDKHTFALQTANALIDKGEAINLEAGLKQELSALQAICRNKETIDRLLQQSAF